MSHVWAVCAVLALTLTAAVVCVLDPIPVQSLRLAQFDQLQRWHPRLYTPVPVRVVDIDEAALKTFGQWPWPRSRLAELVDRLHAAGPAAIALDVLLTEPDRNAPAAMAQLWNNPQVTAALANLPDPDATLADSMRTSAVVLGSHLARNGVATPTAAPHPPPYRVINSGDGNATLWLRVR